MGKGGRNRIVLKITSRNLFIMTGALLVNVGISIIYSESLMPFIVSASIAFIVGLILHRYSGGRQEDERMMRKDAYLTVASSWIVLSIIGSLPYVFSGAIPSVTDAVFESVSGFTTTGSSILKDIESLPKSILFWRSMTHWIGGIGIIVLVIVVMPTLQIGGYHLFTMESSLQDKIQPKIHSVGIRLLFIYLILTFGEILFLLAGGMNLYESVCHAFGTIATGGFSPRNDSIAGYSPYIQYVIMVFMVLAGTNFIIHYYLLKKNFRKIAENEEVRLYLTLVLVIGTISALAIYFNLDRPAEEAFREGFFQVISVVTCTGFATADYMQWPTFAWMLIFFTMFLGGSTGSTAGGIKMIRHLLLFKNVLKMLRRLVNPNAVLPVRLNHRVLDDGTNNSALAFISNYFLIFGIGSMVLILIGNDAMTACSSVATSMAGIGPGLGPVGPVGNFSHLSDLTKIILSFLMLVGRLEIYTILILFTPGFWTQG